MKDQLHAERPRERCLEMGPSCLSLRECIALILGSGPPDMGCMGVAHQILQRPGSGLEESELERAFFIGMESAGSAYLQSIPGLGPAGKAKLLAAFEIGRRYSIYRDQFHRDKKSTSLPELSENALQKVSSQDRAAPQEWLGFVPLYRTLELGELCIVERGVRTHVNTDPAELFARLLSLRPGGFFLFHNHPSGSLIPSPQDHNLTDQVYTVAHQLGIQLLGHAIVTSRSEYWIPFGPGQCYSPQLP